MDDLPRQRLRAIVSTHGRAVCQDPERLGALLTKVCPDHPRETQVLYHALDALLEDDALTSLGERPWKSVAEPVIDGLVADHSMTEDDASWATTSWGIALGEITPDQRDSPSLAESLPKSTDELKVLSDESSTTNHRQLQNSDSPLITHHSSLITPSAPAPNTFRKVGVVAAIVVGGLILISTLAPSVGTFKRGREFLNHPASYWSQKLQEPIVRREVWQGRQRIMKDVDPAADLRQPEAVPVLMELLEDGNASVRRKATSILAAIGAPARSAIPALQHALNDSDADVRATAAEALRKLESASTD